MHLPKFFNFKYPFHDIDFSYVHPNLLMLLGYIGNFALKNNIKPVFTSIIRNPTENQKYRSGSITHVQGRAADMSLWRSHGWKYELVQQIVDELNFLVDSPFLEHQGKKMKNPFHNVGALSARDGVQRVIVVHKNYNVKSAKVQEHTHAHIQVRPSKTWLEFISENNF